MKIHLLPNSYVYLVIHVPSDCGGYVFLAKEVKLIGFDLFVVGFTEDDINLANKALTKYYELNSIKDMKYIEFN